jgi:uncharacterized protein (DUF305 family)
MKYCIILTAALSVLVSCNENGSNTNDSDTTTTGSRTDTSTNAARQPSGSSGELMTAMTNMMQDMKSMEKTGDPDHDFAMMMSRHHQGATDMANIELSMGTDLALQRMARKILEDSRKEADELRNFVQDHQGKSRSGFADKAMVMMENSMRNQRMMGNVDSDFAMMMIQHHKDGIEMAREYLETGTAEKPKQIARDIIEKQPREIDELQKWVDTHQ